MIVNNQRDGVFSKACQCLENIWHALKWCSCQLIQFTKQYISLYVKTSCHLNMMSLVIFPEPFDPLILFMFMCNLICWLLYISIILEIALWLSSCLCGGLFLTLMVEILKFAVYVHNLKFESSESSLMKNILIIPVHY